MNTTNIKDNKDSLKMTTVDPVHKNIHKITDPSGSVTYDYHRENSCNDNSSLLNIDDNDPLLVQERLSALGRRLVHYETMFQKLNNKLDQSFKKYDTIIQSQQKQIIELNSTISILLNDRMESVEYLKEKLSNNSISGMPSQTTYLNNTPQYQQQQQTDITNMINNTYLLFNTHSTEDLLQEIFSTETSNTSTPITANGTNPTGAQVDLQSKNVSMDIHASLIEESYDPLKDSTEKLTETVKQSKDLPESNNITNNNADSNALAEPLGASASFPIPVTNSETYIRKIRYQPNETLKESQPIHQFKFIRSPHSVKEIWQEYVEGVKGQPSVREMDSRYHSAWRKDPAVSKRYSRRRVLCKAIENGLTKGYDLDTIIELLENHRMVNRRKGTKQPLGWLCQPSNIPQTFK